MLFRSLESLSEHGAALSTSGRLPRISLSCGGERDPLQPHYGGGWMRSCNETTECDICFLREQKAKCVITSRTRGPELRISNWALHAKRFEMSGNTICIVLHQFAQQWLLMMICIA